MKTEEAGKYQQEEGQGKVTMQEADLGGLIETFKDLPDPRSERNQDILIFGKSYRPDFHAIALAAQGE